MAMHMIGFTDIQQVWFVISPQNPFKESKTLLNEHHRKHLVDLAIEHEVNLHSSNIEFKLPRPSYTIDTLAYLAEQKPEHEFAIIMGSDSFTNIKRWKNAEVLLRDYELYIYKRSGFEVDEAMMSEKIQIVEAPLLQISGSHIRKMIRNRKSIRYLVPDVVKEEIESQQYYY